MLIICEILFIIAFTNLNKTMKLNCLISFLWVFVCLNVSSQSNDSRNELKKYFNAALAGNSYYLPSEVLKTIPLNSIQTEANVYIQSDNSFVCIKAIDLIKRYAILTDNNEARQYAVNKIIIKCKDKDSGTAGYAINALKLFNKSDFNNDAVNDLNNLLTENITNYTNFILIVGFAGNSKTMEILENKLEQIPHPDKKTTWNMQLALARLGDENSFNTCFERIKSQGINNKVVENLYPNLIYTRNKKAIDYMLEQIMSNETNCNAPNPDNEIPIICGYKLMELIAPVIIDFPVGISKYDELETDNLNDALIKVRDWYSKKPQYNISNSSY
jgi:hypothetical protein